MSLALIEESAKEVRRLAIAGSPLAVGDFRLKKLALPLDQAGAKVPVFAQVAKAITDLVDGDEACSAERLLSLSTLLNAILYTQGQTGLEGDVSPLATTPVTGSVTRTTARLLRPLQEALTSTGSGRFEGVKSAVDAGSFRDVRLVDPALQALGDAYPELADLVAEKILPGFGPGIAGRLKDGLNLQGKRQDARRLEVLHRVAPATAVPLCEEALESGSPDVKAAAIACLGQHEDYLPLVLEQAKARNKQVKAAALEALATQDRPEANDLLVAEIQGKDLAEMATILRRDPSPALVNAVLAEASKALALALKNNRPGVERLAVALHCLENQRDPNTEDLLLRLMNGVQGMGSASLAASNLGGSGIPKQAAELLYRIGSPRSLESILASREVLPLDCFQLVVQTAIRSWPPARVFDEFAPLLKSRKAADKKKVGPIENAMGIALDREEWAALAEDSSRNLGLRPLQDAEWDPRWLDVALEADQHLMVCYLARPGHPAAIEYLVKSLASGRPVDAPFSIRALSWCQYPRLTEVFMELVTKSTQGVRQVSWATQKLFQSARHLPAADLPKLESFAATLDEKFMEPFLEALASLRSTAPTA
ncbi:MAG: HEAT repeat domain-containing protein [Verrucomicrobia bacterium]|nr:HEAT repeat domain-containing protein [Verrucomicrobiota bacterium]